MKKIYYTLFFMIFFICNSTAEIFYMNLVKDEIRIGKYDDQFRKQPFKSIKIDSLTGEEVYNLIFGGSIDANDTNRVLYYFHSLYGSFSVYHKNSLKKISEIGGFDKVIAIEWHAEAVGYRKTWNKALDQGQRLSRLMNYLLSRNTNSILCHSMGNRVFEGILEHMNSQTRIEKLVLAASDLDVNFYSNTALNQLKNSEVIVLVNEKDKTLKLSKLAHHRKRLGLNGAEAGAMELLKDRTYIDVINVTKTLKCQLFRSGHTYFKTNKKVFGRIKTFFENENPESNS